MYIETVPNRNSPPAYLLRIAKRVNGKIVKKTIANLSALPLESIEILRLSLKGINLCESSSEFAAQSAIPSGHVNAIAKSMKRLDLANLISSKPSRNRDVILALITQRLIDPCSKLEASLRFSETTIAREFCLDDSIDENAIYDAMDWLVEQQARIESKLAKRHLATDSRVFYDLSCSSYYGTHCELAKRGYNRDGLKLPAIEYGLLTDMQGRPISIHVYPGNTSDSKTVIDQVDKLKNSFDLNRIVLVGDRGMLTGNQIEKLSKTSNFGWVSCLRSTDIRKLIEDKDPSDAPLFTQEHFAEIAHSDFPNERLIMCYNPLLATDRTRTRNELLDQTEILLVALQSSAQKRTKKQYTDAELGEKIGRRINKYKMAKHFSYSVSNGSFTFERNEESIKNEEALDGIYVIRTSEPEKSLSAEDAIRTYKSLGNVEKAFRTIKGNDINVRPIHHRLDARVRAHIFLCMLVYYVEWHMRRALSSLMYTEDCLDEARQQRNPVAKAKPTKESRRKKATGKSTHDFPLRNWQGIISALATQSYTTILVGKERILVPMETEPNAFQQKVLSLIEQNLPIWKRGVPSN